MFISIKKNKGKGKETKAHEDVEVFQYKMTRVKWHSHVVYND